MELGGSKTATKSPTWPCDPIAGKKKNNRTPDRESCFCGENTIVSLALSRAFNESFVDSIQKLLENNEYQGTTGELKKGRATRVLSEAVGINKSINFDVAY